MEEIKTPKQYKEDFINDLENRLWESEVTLDASMKILPEMENKAELIQGEADRIKGIIDNLSKDPSREAREKRKKEEERLRVQEAKLSFQNMQINGGQVGDKRIKGVKEQIAELETTIRSLTIFAETAKKHK